MEEDTLNQLWSLLDGVRDGSISVQFRAASTALLYTSCQIGKVRNAVAENPDALMTIRETEAGQKLLGLNLFNETNGLPAYLAWAIVSTEMIKRNAPEKVYVLADPTCATSLLWNLELPMLKLSAPRCAILDYERGVVLTEADLEDLSKPHLRELIGSNCTSGALLEDWRSRGCQDACPITTSQLTAILFNRLLETLQT